jgi:hypothetical protein
MHSLLDGVYYIIYVQHSKMLYFVMENKLTAEAISQHMEEEPLESMGYKFLLTSDGQLFISDQQADALTTLTHADWAARLQEQGLISPETTIKGGYIKKVNNKIEFWGESSNPISGATEQELFDALLNEGAVLVSAER